MKFTTLFGALLLSATLGNAVAADAPATGQSMVMKSASKGLSMEARLRRVEDHIEIERLLMDYGKTLDARDFAAYSQLFATDGEWSGSIGTFKGPAQIEAAMIKAFKVGPAATAPGETNFHLMTNPMIDINGDHATAVSKWSFVRIVDGKPVIQLSGRYEDTLVREQGVWKFQRRYAPPIPGAPGPTPANATAPK
jgi:ketosteroid isomerase-like protein